MNDDIPFEFSINKDRFKCLLNDIDRLRKDLKMQTCPICLDELICEGLEQGKNAVTISPCHDLHAFHKDCIAESLKHDNRCPCCRLFISLEFLED
mmetsp:Transcript_58195/g.126488  ORF Transcript_58195/g.126488 Transcript_58195/m.126488 type:complete len:95 (-) Transcript_58195:88-372(-)